MIYKVVIIIPNREDFVIYQGIDKQAADDAWAVTAGCGYTREYYDGVISWDRKKSLLS